MSLVETPLISATAVAADELEITWRFVETAGKKPSSAGECNFELQQAIEDPSKFQTVFEGPTTSFVAKQLALATIYCFRIRAKRNKGRLCGAWSRTVIKRTGGLLISTYLRGIHQRLTHV